MKFQKFLLIGLIAGLIMGIALFFTGAIAARVAYGPQMVPPGKFTQEQINPWYFFWTKLVIGGFFGILFSFIYTKLPLSKDGGSALKGLLYGFILWLIISLWGISHPLIYGPFETRNEIFWLIYSLGGYLAYGTFLGFLYRRMSKKKGK